MRNTVNQHKRRKLHLSIWLEPFLATLLLLCLFPVHLLNTIMALVNKKTVLVTHHKIDALGRIIKLYCFSCGYVKNSAVLLNIVTGQLAIVGVSLNHTIDKDAQAHILSNYRLLPGLISLYDLHQSVGLESESPYQLLLQQLNLSQLEHLMLMFKGIIGLSMYQGKQLTTPKVANLFELPINNVKMEQAVGWAIHNRSLVNANATRKTPQLGFFINAHSVNVAEENPQFKSCLRHANALFADGSGMRFAAKSKGINIQSNINGTDMLPFLCKAAQANKKSIFLLGGKQDIAKKTALRLTESFPNLNIVGTHHGFFNFNNPVENEKVIQQINASKADIVLVGLGSPQQEFWCQQHIGNLQCSSVLAVGGLFDYFSGAIPRAPIYFRELGLEWVWRLRQEPAVKFTRYMIGTPKFLVRTFLLK